MAEDVARQGLGHKWIASKQIWVYPIAGEAVWLDGVLQRYPSTDVETSLKAEDGDSR